MAGNVTRTIMKVMANQSPCMVFMVCSLVSSVVARQGIRRGPPDRIGSDLRDADVVLGQDLVEARLVETGDDVLVVLGVPDDLGQGDRGGDQEQGGHPQER